MKTLAIIGSPRKNGHTRKMMDLFLNGLKGEVKIIDAYKMKNISPCMDCRYCWKKKECAIKDGMQEIYKEIEVADNIVLASPVYFHGVTGPMKILIDRLQIYWAGHVRKDMPEKKNKKGVIFMTGGAPAFPGQFSGTETTLKSVLADLNAQTEGVIRFSDSDHHTLETCPQVAEEIKKLTLKINGMEDYDTEDGNGR